MADHVKIILDSITSENTKTNEDAERIIKLAFSKYDEAIVAIEKKKKKEVGFLSEVDEYVTTLSPDLESIGLDELIKIFTWKNTRGKFRPNINLIKKNDDSSVKSTTKKAFSLIRDNKWEEGLNELEKLHGVGPATATCFFAMDKDNIPFMCDEVLEAVTGQLKYTHQSWLHMRKELVAKASLVNMNASDLCQALWAHSVLTQMDPNYPDLPKSAIEKEPTDTLEEFENGHKKRRRVK